METKIIRVAQGKHSTLSHLYIEGNNYVVFWAIA